MPWKHPVQGYRPTASFCRKSFNKCTNPESKSTYEPVDAAPSINTSTLSLTATPNLPGNETFTPPTTFTDNIRPSAGWPSNFLTAACASFSDLKVRRTVTGLFFVTAWPVIWPQRLKMAWR